jgi:hypothetical protein
MIRLKFILSHITVNVNSLIPLISALTQYVVGIVWTFLEQGQEFENGVLYSEI